MTKESVALLHKAFDNKTIRILECFFDMPIAHAAQAMGIARSTLKMLRHRAGLEDWPYRAIYRGEHPVYTLRSIDAKREKALLSINSPEVREILLRSQRSARRQEIWHPRVLKPTAVKPRLPIESAMRRPPQRRTPASSASSAVEPPAPPPSLPPPEEYQNLRPHFTAGGPAKPKPQRMLTDTPIFAPSEPLLDEFPAFQSHDDLAFLHIFGAPPGDTYQSEFEMGLDIEFLLNI